MGRPPKADGGQRGHRKSMRGEKVPAGGKVLENVDPSEAKIPAMPPAEDFLSQPALDPDDPAFSSEKEELDWSPVVKSWWVDIWSSPMSQEFVIPADLHGLYLGCFYLEKTIDPQLKTTEQNMMSKNFAAVQKEYGLTPQARNTLKWQVAQGETAQKRTERLRADSQPSPAATEDHRQNVVDLYRRNHS